MTAVQRELIKRSETQHQPAPVTPVHVSQGCGEHEEEHRKTAASRENGPPVPGGRQ